MLHRFAASHTGQGLTLLAGFVVVLAIVVHAVAPLLRWGSQAGRPVPDDLQVRRRRKASLNRPVTVLVTSARSRDGGRALFAGRWGIHRRRGSPPDPGTTRGRRRTAAP